MKFIEQIKQRARKNIKTIVLPEAEDIRTIEAAATALKEEYANIVLIGNSEKIKELAESKNLDITKAKIIDPKESTKHSEYAQKLFEFDLIASVCLRK